LECAHRMDTQVNESFNNIAAWMAPKNKVYCGSSSLTNRLGIAVGIKSLGLFEYFKRLFIKLGIHMSPNVVHYLKTKDKSRYARIAKIKTKGAKKARLQGRFEKQKEDEVQAKKERSRRDGTYKSGQAVLNDGEEEHPEQPVAKRAKTSRKDLYCKACKQYGHSTTRSKACLHHEARRTPNTCGVAANPATNNASYILTEEDQAEDVAKFESFPLEQEEPPAEDDEVAVVAVAMARDDRIYDSDGEDVYGNINPAVIWYSSSTLGRRHP
jgi:hypothetical protein